MADTPIGRESGFTLVEIAVVLVIIGLILGGIMGGGALIRAAELRSIGVEMEQYETAVKTFKMKYNELPGDFSNATFFWGRADNGANTGQCADPGTNAGEGQLTCNGDGNGIIDNAGEAVLFWEHLRNAGLVTGRFNGAIASATAMFVRDTEVPSSKSGGVWIPMWIGVSETFPGYTMLLGSGQTVNVVHDCNKPGPFCDVHALLSPEDAKSVDLKLDDGMPGTGRVQAGVSRNPCVGNANLATAAYATAEYNTAIDSVECVLSFPQGNQGWADQ